VGFCWEAVGEGWVLKPWDHTPVRMIRPCTQGFSRGFWVCNSRLQVAQLQHIRQLWGCRGYFTSSLPGSYPRLIPVMGCDLAMGIQSRICRDMNGVWMTLKTISEFGWSEMKVHLGLPSDPVLIHLKPCKHPQPDMSGWGRCISKGQKDGRPEL